MEGGALGGGGQGMTCCGREREGERARRERTEVQRKGES